MRIAEKIMIIDGDNAITGRIRDMTLFAVIIETEEGHIINYPNNLVIQKPIQMIRES
jgi:small-conductance mechanosensitive channel